MRAKSHTFTVRKIVTFVLGSLCISKGKPRRRGRIIKPTKSRGTSQSFEKIRSPLVFPLKYGQKYSRLSPLFAVEILIISSLRKLSISATGGGRLLSLFQHLIPLPSVFGGCEKG